MKTIEVSESHCVPRTAPTWRPHLSDAELEQAKAELRVQASRKWGARLLPGHLAAVALFTALAFPTHDRFALIAWAIATALSSFVVFMGGQLQRTPSPKTRTGISRFSYGASILHGVAWGAAVWVDLGAADDPLVRWWVACFLLAISAGYLASVEATSFMAQLLLVAMWAPAAAGFAYAGDNLMALCGWVLLAALSWVFHERRRALDQLVHLQVESQQREQVAQWAADHDPLTGLLNRGGLRSWFATTEACDAFAVFIDLDHFKKINDRYGHSAGDSVLTEAAHRIATLVCGDSVAARLGGDEFLVVVPGEDQAEVQRRCEALIIALEHLIELPSGDQVSVSASLGLAAISPEAFDFDRAVRESDLAMYEAKKSERKKMQIFLPSMVSAAADRHELAADLCHAVRNGAIEAWGQPIVHLLTGEVAHVELLARWRRSDGSVLLPESFIALAEETGIVGELTDVMLDHAGRALSTFADYPWLANAGVAVNISGFEFNRRDVAAAVRSAVERYEISAGKLVIELTQSVGFDPISATSVFGQLAHLGVDMALDDFGSHPTSMGDLLDVGAAIVKVDQTLVERITSDDPRGRTVISALQLLADTLGFTLVAECVEHAPQVDHLVAAGLRYGQGFLFAEPKPLSELVTPAIERALHEFTSGVRHPTSDGLIW